MLGTFLQILSILGIILLALLALSVTVLLLVLFFPVFYRVSGEKDESGLRVRAKAKWLFGLLRADFQYPEPGRMTARFLWFRLYDAKIPAGDEEGAGEKGSSGKRSSGEKGTGGKKSSGEKGSGEKNSSGVESSGKDRVSAEGSGAERKESHVEKPSGGGLAPDGDISSGVESSAAEEGGNTAENIPSCDSEGGEERETSGDESAAGGKISQKIEKIKYTIRSIYDKIKEIWENIKYYIELLQEEDTKQLFSHVWFRLCRILKHIRPRHLRADILFGTGSPDTTGYAYGVYCMLSSTLGPGFWVTPDFERAVLKAEFEVSGHITLWVLLVNVLKVLLDQKLRQFIRKMKAGKSDRLKA